MNEEIAATVPRHVGYILDGNRRWARTHGLPVYEGHLAGYEALKQVIFASFDAGIQYVSVYAFSTENWNRADSEVSRLMKLSMKAFKADLKQFIKRNIRVRVMGVTEGLDNKIIEAAQAAERQTAELTGGTLCICFNYGGQREIIDAARAIVAAGIPADAVTPEVFEQHLYAPGVPLLDVVVRTSGEQRLSNFMLWRAAYSELIFLEKFWPDMREADVREIIEAYQRRGRRFGH